MDAQEILALGEWRTELEWIKKEMYHDDELRFTPQAHLHTLLEIIQSAGKCGKTLAPSQYVALVTLAVAVRFFRAQGCEPTIFPQRNPDVVLSVLFRGRHAVLVQDLNGDMTIYWGVDRKVGGRLVALLALTPGYLVEGKESLQAFFARAIRAVGAAPIQAAKSAATPNKKATAP